MQNAQHSRLMHRAFTPCTWAGFRPAGLLKSVSAAVDRFDVGLRRPRAATAIALPRRLVVTIRRPRLHRMEPRLATRARAIDEYQTSLRAELPPDQRWMVAAYGD